MPLPPEAKPLVIKWVRQVKRIGIRSVICLLEHRRLDRCYVSGGLGLHDRGLFGFYESRGLGVRHSPMTDYQRPHEKEMRNVFRAFLDLPRPILLHCSAGIDRTAPVAAFIVYHHTGR